MPTTECDDNLSPLQRRIVAITLLLLAILLFSLLVILPLINVGLKLNEQKHNLIFKLQRYEKTIAGKEAMIANIQGFQQENTIKNYFNNQETETLAAASMQELLKEIIVNAGGQLRSTQVVSDDHAGDSSVIHIPVKVTMTVNSATLRTVLYKIENALPLMIVNQLEIRPVRDEKTLSNQLEVDLQVVSFMRKKANES
ncbi:hypothetical protein DOJK_02303 [Patescibacteria group bacterium]|nr:hypothetical protein DOJK_02303 [Patescibacteria group bacterium]